MKAILAEFYKIRQGTVDFGWLLQTHRAPFNLSKNSLYELEVPQEVHERAEKLQAKIGDVWMEIAGQPSSRGKIAEDLSDLKEDVKKFFDYVKGKDPDGSLSALCGCVQESYDDTEKSAKDNGIVK